MTENTEKKKLIEVALPLDAINVAAAREKSIRHGHPSTLHLWWARRPLAAARAVLFAQMVDDPSAHPGLFPTKEEQDRERQRLFRILEELVLWESSTDEEVLEKAREEIRASWRRTCAENRNHPRATELFDPERLPAFHDPFAGGGALPLEAQRLGLESYASDLNPVAVLINKAMIEIPPRFAGRPPVNPEARKDNRLFGTEWKGACGLAEDVRHYGRWMRDEAERRIGHLYPKVGITPEMVAERPDLEPYKGAQLTVIAWLWARTVKSPNPAFASVDVPLVSSFMLSTKPGREAYVEPVVGNGGYRFVVKIGKPGDPEAAKSGTKLSRGAHFRCLLSGTPIVGDYIRAEGKAGRMGARLMAIVAEGDRGRVYLSPTAEQGNVIRSLTMPEWVPETSLPDDPRHFSTVQYGLTTYGSLFTPRQLVALTTFSDLVGEAMECVRHDAAAAGLRDASADAEGADGHLRDGGSGPLAYAEAVGTYLAFAVDKAADYWSTICSWHSSKELIRNTFARQAIPMIWDFAEANIFSGSTANMSSGIEWIGKTLSELMDGAAGFSRQCDAQAQVLSYGKIVSTDPPYYDNIGYADLSDFFYVWLRRSLQPVFPDLFATMSTPKDEELIASPYRHGSRENAESFFLGGMTRAMEQLAEQGHPAFPVTVYYAFKQSETDEGGTVSTGWETFLAAVIRAGFAVTGTWPMRTELGNRMLGRGTNALASSIVLVCRRRPADAPVTTRRDFLAALKDELAPALRLLQSGNIAPVDLAQAAIGPGMAVFTRSAAVLDAQGKPLSVGDALALINKVLDEMLVEQEGDFDAETRWALAWFEQHGFDEEEFGTAETLSKAKNVSVEGLAEAGILESRRGRVRLLPPGELFREWDPAKDSRLTAWEMVHHLIRVLESAGETSAAELVAKMRGRAETARDLAYRLYALCERKKRTGEGLSYNGLVQSWPEIVRLARGGAVRPREQLSFESEE
ncbi:DUF1156 domain-containing protein [Aminiphilus circumscriptus]|uniref:DUF1156 domain-containing protein n=1 Tax=Aminiphilus circumscriptus TaxID=290732 RepID=UPI0004785519|nr:DUF1156 domain-containing protein [Aminiphilus circumscriptus]